MMTTEQLRAWLDAEGCAGLYTDAHIAICPEQKQVSLYATALDGRELGVAYSWSGQVRERDKLASAAVSDLVRSLARQTSPAQRAHLAEVIPITSAEHACTMRELDVQGREDVHDRMVRVLKANGESVSVGLRSAGDVDFWDLTPEQAEWLGVALIQVAAEVRVESGDR